MTIEQFLSDITDIFQTEEVLSLDTKLKDLNEWDSISMMSCMAYLDNKFNIAISLDDCRKFQTIRDIAQKAGI